MEIRRWLCFIFVNCTLTKYLEAKTVSLNELIAADSKTNQATEKQSPKFIDRGEEPNSSDEIHTAETKIKLLPKKIPPLILPGHKGRPMAPTGTVKRGIQGMPTPWKINSLLKRSFLLKRLVSDAKRRKRKLANKLSRTENLSPLKLKKAFEIKSPLKPKKLKGARRSRLKRKNLSRKREVHENDATHKHIPILKNLRMLFDNLVDPGTSNSYEVKPKKYRRNRFHSEEQSEAPHDQSSEASSRLTKFKSREKTTTPSSSVSIDVSSDTKSLTPNKDYDHSTHRPDKSIPILLSRNTISSRRDNNGPSERSGTTFHGDVKRNITRDYGDHEYNTGCGRNESCKKGDENNTFNATRNDSSGVRYSRGNRFNSRNSKGRETLDGNKSKNENANDNFGENQLETGRDKIESKDSVREPIRGLRGFVPGHKNSDEERVVPEPIQLKEIHEKSILSATNNSTGNKRIVDKSGPIATEDEKIRKRNETVIVIERNSQISHTDKGTGKKVPVVMIFDGYSVTRDKNGENKVLGKTIHFQT